MADSDTPPEPRLPRRSGSAKRRRDFAVTIRLDETEFAIAAHKADATGYALAAFGRAAMLGSAGPRAQRRLPSDRRELLRLLGAVNRVGSNINQIARALNASPAAGLSNPASLAAALADINAIRHDIHAALGKSAPPAPPPP